MSFETPPTSLSPAEAESKKKVVFELNGTSVPAEEFMMRPAEAAEAIAGAKEQQEILNGFHARIGEALRNIESGMPSESEEPAVEGAAGTVKRELPENDDDGAFLLKIASLAERIPGGKNALGALALVVGLSSLPKNAEAFSFDPVTVVEKEVDRGVNDGVRRAGQDTGRAVGEAVKGAVDAVRKSIGLETPQERAQREAEERRAAQQLEQEHARELQKFKQEQDRRVREDTRKVTDFERVTEQYRRKLEDVRRSFNQEFDQAQTSYMQQRERANTPEQVKRYERDQWQRWLQASRSALQRLEQYDREIDNTAPDASNGVVASLAQRVAGAKVNRSDLLQSSAEMRQALTELSADMEKKLGVTDNMKSPLRKLEEKKVVPSPQSVGQSSEKGKTSSPDDDWNKIDPKYRF